MSSTVEKIKDRLTVNEVIGSYLKLEKAGTNFRAKCPFHNEKTPSFFVSPDRGSFYCFGCGVKGDIFSFVQEFERVDFMGALKILAERAGVEIEKENFQVKSERDRLYSVLEQATEFFVSNLKHQNEALDYLRGRGLKDEMIKEWRIGYAKDEWRGLEAHLKSLKWSEADLEKAGLTKGYDRFRDRIMFPLFDPSGRVVGFSGRILHDKKDEKGVTPAKYLNSPETELFNKSSILYGYHKAKNEIRVKDYSILVEGQMDLLISHQAGYKNTVATSGTALTANHLGILQRISNKVMVVYDSDTAGLNASIKAWATALTLGLEVKIAQLPTGSDPADLIIADPEKYRECLKNSKHIIDFYLEALLARKLDSRRLGLEIGEKILPYVRALQSSIEQSHYINLISERAGIKSEAVWEELKKIPVAFEEKKEEAGNKKINLPSSKQSAITRQLVGIVFWKGGHKVVEERIESILGKDLFDKTLKDYEVSRNDIVFEAEAYFNKAEALEKQIEELLVGFENEYLKEKFAQKMEELSVAEKNKDVEAAARILRECQEISNKLATLQKIKFL